MGGGPVLLFIHISRTPSCSGVHCASCTLQDPLSCTMSVHLCVCASARLCARASVHLCVVCAHSRWALWLFLGEVSVLCILWHQQLVAGRSRPYCFKVVPGLTRSHTLPPFLFLSSPHSIVRLVLLLLFVRTFLLPFLSPVPVLHPGSCVPFLASRALHPSSFRM